MSKPKRVLLAQRGCAEHYPPVLHQAALLGDVADVTLLDATTSADDPRVQTNGSVQRLRVEKQSGEASTRLANVIPRIKWISDYRRAFKRLASPGTDVVIAYEPDAINLLLTTRFRSPAVKRVAHLHEITQDDPSAPLAARLKLKVMLRRLERADVVVVPDTHRARLVNSAVRLKREPLVVMNCPRRLAKLPPSALTPLLEERGLANHKVVHYQGSVGPDHNLEVVIRSMPFWPLNSIFVIIGSSTKEYLAQLTALAASAGMKDRVIFVGRIPYDQVFGYAVGASVGVTLLDTSIPNWNFSAGASNKRFEYAALGIPQVTNDGPGIGELFVQPGIAAIADRRDPADIGKKISEYLVNEAWSREVSERCRAKHLQSYNYEYQFQKVLDLLS